MNSPPDPELLAKLLEHISAHEPLEATLAAFPALDRTTLASKLAALAASLAPLPPRSPRTVAPPLQDPPAGMAKTGTVPRALHAVRVYSDGAARGNPGPAGAGAVLKTPEGEILERLGKFLGHQTNNVAEYAGVLLGLRRARELGARDVEVYADSQLMIRQLGGIYKVKNEGLKPLHAEAVAMLRGFGKVKLVHIPREQNGDADEMSNRAIDERM